jgi:hypothetical protein
MRPVARLHVQIGGGEQLGEVAVARLILHQQGDMRRLFAGSGMVWVAGGEFHRQQRAHDGLNARLGQGVGNLIDPEQIVAVGDRHRRRPRIARQLGQLLGPHRPFQQGIGAFDAQMDKGRHGDDPQI